MPRIEETSDEVIESLQQVHHHLLDSDQEHAAAFATAVDAVFGTEIRNRVAGEVQEPSVFTMSRGTAGRKPNAAELRALRATDKRLRVFEAHNRRDDVRRALSDAEEREANRIVDGLFRRA